MQPTTSHHIGPGILGVCGALPDHRYPQARLTEAFAEFAGLDGPRRRLLERVHGHAGVHFRHLALPVEQYAELGDFGDANDAFITTACDLGQAAVGEVLEVASVPPDEVDMIITASTTGLAVPSIDARIAPGLGLRPDVKRVPIVGLGCAAGAAGIARAADYLAGHPDQIVVLVTVELCTLTLQRDDRSTANLIASGLFGDGAAAVVLAGRDRVMSADRPSRSPEVVATRSRLYPESLRVMGWDVGPTGLQIVLGAEIPELVHSELAKDIDVFLADQDLSRADIDWWVCHPGGPKVLEAVQDTLDLRDGELQLTWDSLAEIGNLSSASVLHVLDDTLRTRPPQPGAYGLMLALGPGFSLELVLLRG
ncbi:type III polyketide synthase [Microlunatus soli]|uniref:Isopalmitoylresorcinol synthase n=1 Tax=Microlunatus soli TaxID=630515 RepID=A0A1H1N527_9ACTN|nr:3-oxoacyl-[acyl-carrier-protein] synthase III C-terminal domain-containing protein [Microlunatus soli]SDR93269.1 isopalmitoylresorcinol synthase [Microlunatus soli]